MIAHVVLNNRQQYVTLINCFLDYEQCQLKLSVLALVLRTGAGVGEIGKELSFAPTTCHRIEH